MGLLVQLTVAVQGGPQPEHGRGGDDRRYRLGHRDCRSLRLDVEVLQGFSGKMKNHLIENIHLQ